jgi:hypothetical protein
MRTGRKKPGKSGRAVDSGRVVICISLSAADAARLDAFGEVERERVGLEPRRGTVGAMLIRKALDAVEAGA